MLHPRRPQSSATTASIAMSLIVVLLAVADLGTSIQPSRTPRLKCLSTGGPVSDPKNARVVTCFSEPSFCEWSSREKSYTLGCADRWRCDKDLANQSADKQDVCCSTDLCNKDYETATGQTTAITTTPTTTAPTTTSATTTTPKTTPTSTTPTTTAPQTTSTSSATTAVVHVKTTMGQHPTTRDATIESRTTYAKNNTVESITVQPAMTSQQYSTATDHASNASQSTPGELTSISISAGYSSSGPTPNTSIDNVTRADVSTKSGGTKGPLETTSATADTDKTNAYTGSDRSSSASIADKTGSTKGTPSTSFTTSEEQSAAGLSASTPTADSSVPYEWIALLAVGVVGALICGVFTLLAFLGIICAPKQSQGPNVISKELDKTLL